MFSLLAHRNARSGISTPQKPRRRPSTRARSSKNATRTSAQQAEQVATTLISFPPFDLAQTTHGILKYLDAVMTAERNSPQKEVIEPAENNQQANQKSSPVAKKLHQEQAKSSQEPPVSEPPSPRRSKTHPRKLSLSHVLRPSKTQLPPPDPRLRALGPMAAGIAVDD